MLIQSIVVLEECWSRPYILHCVRDCAECLCVRINGSNIFVNSFAKNGRNYFLFASKFGCRCIVCFMSTFHLIFVGRCERLI